MGKEGNACHRTKVPLPIETSYAATPSSPSVLQQQPCPQTDGVCSLARLQGFVSPLNSVLSYFHIFKALIRNT